MRDSPAGTHSYTPKLFRNGQRLGSVLIRLFRKGPHRMATATFTPGTITPQNWNTATNWDTKAVPTAADTAVINTAGTAGPVIFGTTDAVAAVTLNPAGAAQSNLFIGGADYIPGNPAPTSAGPGTLTVGGAVTDNGGFLAVNSSSDLTAASITLAGPTADLGGGGTVNVSGAISNTGVILANAADVGLATPLILTAGAITGAGSIEVRTGSALELSTTTSEVVHVAAGAGGATTPATLDLDTATFGGTIGLDTGTSLNLFLAPGEAASGATVSGTSLVIGGTSETIALGGAGYGATFTPAGAGGRAEVTLSPVCFARGTRIATETGEVAVEDLHAGDQVRLAGGGTAPIVWIGRRKLDCSRHPDPRQVWPVRIQAGAFGPGLPSRDLLVSPQHAIYDEGVLIPARFLVNGRTVTQEQVGAIEYFHVELKRHDLLLAEGLASESYLDTGDRASFENAGGAMVLHPDFARLTWDARACAELKVTGPELAAVRAKLALRAEAEAPRQRKAG